MITDDMVLVREYAARQSEEAFATIVERHVGLVHSAALRQVIDEDLAQEITQAVFIILSRKARSMGPDTILSAWLYRTTRYAAADALKIQRRRERREQEAYMQSALLDHETEDAWTQLSPILDDAMADLGERDRAALLLRYFENKTATEVAAAMKLTEAAAHKRVNRALEKLRKFFTKRGVTLSATLIAGAVAANSVQAAPVGLAATVTATAAHGVTAGGSTLILVKAAMKLMAWAKMKTAIIVGVGVLLAAGTTAVVENAKESGLEYRGTLKVVWPMAQNGPKTNFYVVSLLSKPPYWELSLTSSNENHKVFASPEQTFEVDLWDNPPTGPMNTATIKIIPGARPLTDRMAEHIWLALLSRDTYIGKQLPLPDNGLIMWEPSMIKEVVVTMQDASPRRMRWQSQFPGYRSIFPKGQFEWLAITNVAGGLNIPTTSQMTGYVIDRNGNRKIHSFSELTIDRVTPLNTNPEAIPKIKGRNVIDDYRACDFSKPWSPGSCKQYEVWDGKGLDKAP